VTCTRFSYTFAIQYLHTGLHLAVRYGSLTVATVLTAAGCDIAVQNSSGCSAVDLLTDNFVTVLALLDKCDALRVKEADVRAPPLLRAERLCLSNEAAVLSKLAEYRALAVAMRNTLQARIDALSQHKQIERHAVLTGIAVPVATSTELSKESLLLELRDGCDAVACHSDPRLPLHSSVDANCSAAESGGSSDSTTLAAV
jgi:Ankyrin repeats (many copies)